MIVSGRVNPNEDDIRAYFSSHGPAAEQASLSLTPIVGQGKRCVKRRVLRQSDKWILVRLFEYQQNTDKASLRQNLNYFNHDVGRSLAIGGVEQTHITDEAMRARVQAGQRLEDEKDSQDDAPHEHHVPMFRAPVDIDDRICGHVASIVQD
ncbi:hypothetical protein T440DRAFT_222889 [Plenodomus tracheiphilus IPT5]|uniref:Uncharacterized protein n=1 Tax=Plenodomus tracheiphilus IPT5 TaxID=1408161 RepID=A0A6A7AX62_9PLEO|nr:hypothetical protein T440DRAFT_222889 [Plenodomus tracheiphilus IPT5]